MTDPSMTAPPRPRCRITVNVLLPLLVTAIVIVGCSGSDDADTATGQSDDQPTDGADVGSPIGACETSVTAPEIDYRDTSELTDQEQQVLEVFRERSASLLVEQNPVSCHGLVDVPARVEAEEFGAFEAKSFTHTDPEIRYDLLYFTERQSIDSTIREDITTRLSAINEPDSSLRVWTVADTLFLAVTTPADDADAEAIAAHYNQLIAGEE